ncbi:MAG: hypothetical protein OK454_05030, partial [Thaumarchaeota archaeon]|nr:hypothetical protein [Nitrososphaerota archaeon]
ITAKVAAKAKESTTRSPVNRKEGAVVAVTPPWDTLPYHILNQIFDSASVPLDDINSVRWLVGASRTCRAFAEPALTALYKSPPCLSQAMAHKLVALIARPPSRTMFNYRQKIESLVINVGDIASRLYLSQSLNLRALVQHLRRLTEIDLFHEKDMAPYRQLDVNLRWQYPAGLLAALGIGKDAEPSEDGPPETKIKLKAWRWSARMMGQEMTTEQLESVHKTPSMASLQKLSFVNFQRPSLNSRQDADQNPELLDADLEYAKTLAASLSVLPDLKHLVFESSTAANDLLLPRLPDTIEHLELINCWDVNADNLSDYLMSHGRSLRYLTLHHNQSLSLGFLPLLGVACPNLRALRMNLTYYNHHEFYNDSGPMYDVLLLADQVPSWPASLRVIELEHLRRWSPEAAETFFSSLEQSAHTLQDLRYLGIKAMLDIPWRQRSEMRDKWEGKLKRAFLRKCPEPIPFRTLRDFERIRHLFYRSDGQQADRVGEDATNGTEASPPAVMTLRCSRRSQRIAASQADGTTT